MFLIDIAVPRNIEPSVNELEGVFLYDIDDLQKVVEQNLKGRRQEAEEAEQIVADEVERLLTRLRAREMGPMIVSLQQQLEAIRASELERVRGKLGGLSLQQEQAIEMLTKGIINKIAHAPITELRRHAETPNGSHVVEVIRKVFRLERG
jgi:glutamyl-tRNA reductase